LGVEFWGWFFCETLMRKLEVENESHPIRPELTFAAPTFLVAVRILFGSVDLLFRPTAEADGVLAPQSQIGWFLRSVIWQSLLGLQPDAFELRAECQRQALNIRHPPEQRTKCTMADDTTKRDYRGSRPDQCPQRLRAPILDKGVTMTPEKLKGTVEKAGVLASDVRKALGKLPDVVVEA
jgi:hypothetical protein